MIAQLSWSLQVLPLQVRDKASFPMPMLSHTCREGDMESRLLHKEGGGGAAPTDPVMILSSSLDLGVTMAPGVSVGRPN